MSLPEDVWFWLRFALTAVAIIAPFHRRIVVVISGFVFALKTLPPPTLDGEFVERPKLKEAILKAASSRFSETVLIYGERGGGKTTLIQHAFKNRRGVMTISIGAPTQKEAQDEMIEEISSKLHIFNTPQKRNFIEQVFAMGFTSEPIVVVSLEAKCGGDTLEGVVTLSKILSYENRYKTHPRIVIDISGSRAAIESGLQFYKHRVIGVHVGPFLEQEALSYVTDRMPMSFEDPLRRQAIASLVLEKFDWHVIKLQNICALLEAAQPTDPKEVEALVDRQIRLDKESAWAGWMSFRKNLEAMANNLISEECWEKVAVLLLEEEQQARVIIDRLHAEILQEKTSKRLTPRDIGLANADASHRPLIVDPFKTTVLLVGKAVATKLEEEYKAVVRKDKSDW